MKTWKAAFVVVVAAVVFAGCFFGDAIAQTIDSFGFYDPEPIAETPPTIQEKKDLEFKEVKAGDRFHLNVIKAARKQFRERKISWREYRNIRFYMSIPGFRKQAEKAAIIQIKTTDDPNADKFLETVDFSNIDWNKLLDFIERLIPIILSLIDALAMDDTEWQIRQKINDLQDRTNMLREHTDRFRQSLAA